MPRERGLRHVHGFCQFADAPRTFAELVQNEDSFGITDPLADLLIKEAHLLFKLFIHRWRSLLCAYRLSLENQNKESSKQTPNRDSPYTLSVSRLRDLPVLALKVVNQRLCHKGDNV